MSREEEDRFDPVRRFVVRERLHVNGPVDARAFIDRWNVRYVSFSDQTLGCSAFGKRWRRDHRILVNARLDRLERRAVVGHELSHRLLGHASSVYLCSLGSWWYARSERDAEIGSALIWVCRPWLERRLMEGSDLAELEMEAGVPARLLRLRLEVR